MYKKYIGIFLLLIATLSFIVGCGFLGRDEAPGPKPEETALQYVTDLLNHNWEGVIQRSTGDQLSNLVELLPTLETIKASGNIRKIEVINKDVSEKQSLAFVTVLAVRDVVLEGYGSTIDEQQILVSMKKLDGQYFVYRLDSVSGINIGGRK